MTQTLKVAVIGLGNIGTAVATNLVKSNQSVIVADRKIEKANTQAHQLGSFAQALEIPAAIKEADIVVLAIYFDPIKDFFRQYASELNGKIIVDPSNPIAPDDNGGFKKIIGEQESAGQILSALLPKGAKLAKALGTLGVASLAGAAFQQPERAVLFYAIDDSSIAEPIEQLIRDNGFEPVKAGGLDQSMRLEVFGNLHEFGAIGRPVTLREVREKFTESKGELIVA
jgi:predicted dinucleotide-binding enzyme